jgi:AcrR family transcriptional regulator
VQHLDKFVALCQGAAVEVPAERTGEVLPLRSLVTGLPAPPPASLDPYLDAAARCFARHGIRRTSPQDVAAELKVNRTTVYRQVGNVESMLRLLSARELHRLLGEVHRAIGGMQGPETVVDVLVGVVELVRAHPVVAKVLADERELIGLGLDDIPELLGRIAAAIVPPLELAMEAGLLARRDPVVVAEWLARVAGSTVIAPPPGDLADFFRVFLVPVLEP